MEVNRNAVFVDTAAFYALADPTDQNHIKATRLVMEPLFQRRLQITSNFVLAEVHALIVNRRGPVIALRAIDSILDGATLVIQASESDQRRAIALLRVYVDKGYSMVDAISFAIMERMKITTAFTFDRHFVQHGFKALGLEE